MSERQIVECFIKPVLYHHPLTRQFHRAAGEAGVCVAVYEGRQHDKVDAAPQSVAAVMIMAAEADFDGRGGGKQLGNLSVVPEETMILVGGFGKQREVADDDRLFTGMLRHFKLFLQPRLLPGSDCAAVVVQFGVCMKAGKVLAILLCFRCAKH